MGKFLIIHLSVRFPMLYFYLWGTNSMFSRVCCYVLVLILVRLKPETAARNLHAS